MARRKKGRDISGWVVLDKPHGMTSTKAVSEVKRRLDARKAGHAGTLDPLATGLLAVALGEATKTVPYVQDGRKLYRFTVRWGVETTTDDAEGEAVETSDARPSEHEIEALLPRFTGEIEQVPPNFSAIKVAGERAYDLAREGSPPELAARPVFIESLDLVEAKGDDAVFEARCGKGTYVRSLARDMGRSLGCFGHVSALRRLSVHPFGEAEMISLDALECFPHIAATVAGQPSAVLPVEAALDDIPALALTGPQADRVRRGHSVLLRGDEGTRTGEAYATAAGRLLAIGAVEAGAFRPRRLFNIKAHGRPRPKDDEDDVDYG